MLITARQIRMARAGLDWSQKDLAERCDIAVTSIARIEGDLVSMRLDTVKKIIDAFEDAGVQFIQQDGKEGVLI